MSQPIGVALVELSLCNKPFVFPTHPLSLLPASLPSPLSVPTPLRPSCCVRLGLPAPISTTHTHTHAVPTIDGPLSSTTTRSQPHCHRDSNPHDLRVPTPFPFSLNISRVRRGHPLVVICDIGQAAAAAWGQILFGVYFWVHLTTTTVSVGPQSLALPLPPRFLFFLSFSFFFPLKNPPTDPSRP
jgi:hypothetical protein